MKAKVKIVMAGTCPHCNKEVLRPFPADTAFCKCESVTAVPLELALVLPYSLYKRYERIAKLVGVSVEQLIDKVLEVGIEERLLEMLGKR